MVLKVFGFACLGILVLFVLMFFIPIRIQIQYIGGWHITVTLLGIIPIVRLPRPKKKVTSQKTPRSPDESPSKKKTGGLPDAFRELFAEEGVSGVLAFVRKLVSLFRSTLSRLCRFVTVRQMLLFVQIGASEAKDTAVRTGTVCSALYPALTALSSVVRVRQRRVEVVPDFRTGQTLARMRTVIWLWPFGIAAAGIACLIGLYRTVSDEKSLAFMKRREE